MAKAPAFQFYPKDFLVDTASMSAEEAGAYWRLCCYAWVGIPGSRPGYLPADDARLAKLAGVSAEVWGKAKSTILACFEKVNGSLRHPRLILELRKQREKKKKQSESGKAGAEARWSKARQKKDLRLNGGDSERHPSAMANPWRNDSSSAASSSSAAAISTLRSAAAADEDRYCEILGQAFGQLRGSLLLLSTKDLEAARSWHQAGIPVALVIRAMREVFERRRSRNEHGRVQSLRYFEDAVGVAWAQVQELQAPGRRAPAPPPINVRARLDRLAATLPERLPDRRWIVDELLALEDGDAEAVEAALSALDRELLERVAAALPTSTRTELEAEVADIAAPLVSRLSAEDLDAARARVHRQLLRQRLGLPVLSLFSPELAEPEGAAA